MAVLQMVGVREGGTLAAANLGIAHTVSSSGH